MLVWSNQVTCCTDMATRAQQPRMWLHWLLPCLLHAGAVLSPGASPIKPVPWEPRRDPGQGPRHACPVAPLRAMCMEVLVEYIDCVECE